MGVTSGVGGRCARGEAADGSERREETKFMLESFTVRELRARAAENRARLLLSPTQRLITISRLGYI
jgi:hypothetical protein